MVKSQTLDKKKLCNTLLYKKIIQSLRLRHLPSFDWKFIWIGTIRAKDLRKNVSVFQEGGSTPAPLVIRVVLLLLHTIYGVLNPCFPQL